VWRWARKRRANQVSNRKKHKHDSHTPHHASGTNRNRQTDLLPRPFMAERSAPASALALKPGKGRTVGRSAAIVVVLLCDTSKGHRSFSSVGGWDCSGDSGSRRQRFISRVPRTQSIDCDTVQTRTHRHAHRHTQSSPPQRAPLACFSRLSVMALPMVRWTGVSERHRVL
jgi:hypothetical protein